MWLPSVTIEPATSEPLTLEETKLHLGEDQEQRDTDVQGWIAAARDHVERYTGTRLVEQTVELKASCWEDLAALPIGPVRSVDISYLDSAGDEQVLPNTDYRLVRSNLRSMIRLNPSASWPGLRSEPDAVRIRAVVGYDTLPPAVRAALLLLVGQWYDNRSAVNVGTAVNEMPNSVEALLSNWRIYSIA